MPITYQISTKKLDFLPLDNWWVIGFTYTHHTKSINKKDILQRSFKDKENSTNHMESINIIIYEYYIYVYD